ncbi:MAG: hydroxymethylbilane synthase [Acidiferrobacteraceae bacterium]
MTTLRIGTRKSALALWQAERVRTLLLQHSPGTNVELVPMVTQGDRRLEVALSEIGGKGLFTKELEQALLEGRIHLAVHSMKDVTSFLPDGLHIGAVLERADARDAFVSDLYPGLDAMPPGALVGTSSLRRQSQIRNAWPHLRVVGLRGNVDSRLARLKSDGAQRLDAVILAAAGLMRLGLEGRITRLLTLSESLPSAGQGAIGIECLADDTAVNDHVSRLNHEPTSRCIGAERAMNAVLEGGCQVPIGGYADITGDVLRLQGLVGDPEGKQIVRAQSEGSPERFIDIGREVARDLLAGGAAFILQGLAQRHV